MGIENCSGFGVWWSHHPDTRTREEQLERNLDKDIYQDWCSQQSATVEGWNTLLCGRIGIRIRDQGEPGLILRQSVVMEDKPPRCSWRQGKEKSFAFVVFPTRICLLGPLAPKDLEIAARVAPEIRLARIYFRHSTKNLILFTDLLERNDPADLPYFQQAFDESLKGAQGFMKPVFLPDLN